MAFSWLNHIKKTETKLTLRTLQLLVINPDFKIKHPELVRELEAGNSTVELKKYVKKIVEKRSKLAKVPKPSVIVKRYNRVV